MTNFSLKNILKMKSMKNICRIYLIKDWYSFRLYKVSSVSNKKTNNFRKMDKRFELVLHQRRRMESQSV